MPELNFKVEQMTLNEKYELGVQDPEFSQTMYKVVRVSSGKVVDFLIYSEAEAVDSANYFQFMEDFDD